MNFIMIALSVLFLAANYLAYREKLPVWLPFLFVLLSELSAAYALYSWKGYSQSLFMVALLVLAFTLISFVLPKLLTGLHPLIWSSIAFLVQTGTFMLYRVEADIALRNIIFCLAGILLAALVYLLARLLQADLLFRLFYYGAGASLLFLNNTTINGSTNWTVINGINGKISYQPSEFVKILYALFLASCFLRPFT